MRNVEKHLRRKIRYDNAANLYIIREPSETVYLIVNNEDEQRKLRRI